MRIRRQEIRSSANDEMREKSDEPPGRPVPVREMLDRKTRLQIFASQVAAEFSSKSGIYLKQTAPEGLLRNPKNKADAFEAGILGKLAEKSYPREGDKAMSETVEGGKAVRVMLPLYYGKGCMGCHGAPKGETDISGYKKEGASEGDLGGAISVKLPVK